MMKLALVEELSSLNKIVEVPETEISKPITTVGKSIIQKIAYLKNGPKLNKHRSFKVNSLPLLHLYVF